MTSTLQRGVLLPIFCAAITEFATAVSSRRFRPHTCMGGFENCSIIIIAWLCIHRAVKIKPRWLLSVVSKEGRQSRRFGWSRQSALKATKCKCMICDNRSSILGLDTMTQAECIVGGSNTYSLYFCAHRATSIYYASPAEFRPYSLV